MNRILRVTILKIQTCGDYKKAALWRCTQNNIGFATYTNQYSQN